MKKNKKLISFVAHIIAWICFFSLPYIFLPRARNGQMFNVSNNMLATYIVICLFLILFYYLNTLVLIPRLFKQKRWLLYFSAVGVCFLLFLNAPKPIADLVVKPQNRVARTTEQRTDNSQRRRPTKLTHYPGSYLGFILVFAVGLAISAIQEWLKAEDLKKEMEHQKLNTELSLLKSQINPHFFFNTLNNIYSLAIIKSDDTASSILKLSSIMRYVLTETNHDFVSLASEIEFLQNYVNLQSVRLTDKVKLLVELDGETSDRQIAPLLLIPFVENAFKYGVSTVEPSEISISLHTEGSKLLFTVNNTILHAAKHSAVNTGIGIANVRRRLELLYPGKHKLDISEQDGIYRVNLEINLI
ncbi:MAG TPA: histidine kinase [Chitinophagaceae bacterium]